MLIFIPSIADFQNLAKNKNINSFEIETKDFENLHQEYSNCNKITDKINGAIERVIKKIVNIDKNKVYAHADFSVFENCDKEKKIITFKTKLNFFVDL
jgi:hypothetical protein